MYDVSDSDNAPQREWLLIGLLLSVFFIHVPLLLLFVFSDEFDLSDSENRFQSRQPEPVAMIDLNAVKGLGKQMPIVDIQKTKRNQAPKKASAYGKYNMSVKKEQVAKGGVAMPGQGPGKTPGVTKASPQTQAKDPVTKQNPKPSPKSYVSNLRALRQKTQTKQQDFDKKFQGQTTSPPAQFQFQIGGGRSGGDHLPDYKIGSRTFLNVQANPYIAYYVELKRKFRLTFNPSRALRTIHRQLPRSGVIKVIWGVDVNPQGQLTGLTLIRSSGISLYDQEAKRTIRSSASFSAPPKHLLDKKTGLLSMAWTFYTSL